MRIVVGILLALVAGPIPGWSDDIYRWTDAAGAVHFSNTPAGTDDHERMPATERPAFGESGGSNAADAKASDEGDAAAAGAGDYSTTASLRRNALERELRATDKQLRDLDARLAGLERARTRLAAGSVATGGVGTLAGDARSDEEKELAEQREQVAQHANELRASAEKLRDEVAGRLGGTPAWWVDVR